MAARPPISVFLITLNEGDRLGRTLSAVRDWADEIIVVDSGSSDDTIAIAKAAGAKVFHHPFAGYGAQKRYAEDRCTHDWLLNIDADEVVQPDLRDEIDAILSDAKPALFRIRILNVYPGDSKPRPFADDYNVVRFYHKAAGRYRDHPLYDRVVGQQDAPEVQLHGPIYHYSFSSWGALVQKIDPLTTFQVQAGKDKSQWSLRVRLITEMPMQFIKVWVFRRHILGGWKGFAFSVIAAFGRWLRIAKMLAKATDR